LTILHLCTARWCTYCSVDFFLSMAFTLCMLCVWSSD